MQTSYKWIVESYNNPDKKYTVIFNDSGKLTCSCPDWIYRHKNDEYYQCKHIRNIVQYCLYEFAYIMIKSHNIPVDEVARRLYSDGFDNNTQLELTDSIFKMVLDKNIQEKIKNKLNNL